MSVLLEVKNLKKNYNKVEAVKGISFSIEQGICFGLLGPNGAGKTTVMEVIEDIIPSTSGEVLYKNKPRSSSFNEEIGIQFQVTALLAYLTVHETLKTFGALYTRTNNIKKLINMCHLTEILDQQNDKLSGGQRQRFLLAIALVNDPDLVFLDEPSTGLDPQARRNLLDIVKEIKAEGKTVILTTHYMEEAEYLCDDIAVMDHGKIIAQGSPEQLISKHCKSTAVMLPKSSINVPMDKLPFNFHENEDQIELQTDNINQAFKDLVSLDINLSDVKVHSPNLEDVFLVLTGRKLRE